METITRRFRGELRSFPIYTQKEADDLGIAYKPWREAAGGGWGLSDDGYVAECLHRMQYKARDKKPPKDIVVYPFARVWIAGRNRLSYTERKETRQWHTISNVSWQEREVKKTRTINVVKAYCAMMMGGKIDWRKLGSIYRPEQQIPEATVRRLFKEPIIQRKIMEELEEILKSKGITKSSVIDMYVQAAKLAESRGDSGNIVKAADRLAPMVGLMGNPKNLPPPLPDGELERIATELAEHKTRRLYVENRSEGENRGRISDGSSD